MNRLQQDPQRLMRRRIEAGLSLTALAERAGVTKSHICDVEHGRANFSPAKLGRIADVLGCAIADLMPPAPAADVDAAGSAA